MQKGKLGDWNKHQANESHVSCGKVSINKLLLTLLISLSKGLTTLTELTFWDVLFEHAVSINDTGRVKRRYNRISSSTSSSLS